MLFNLYIQLYWTSELYMLLFRLTEVLVNLKKKKFTHLSIGGALIILSEHIVVERAHYISAAMKEMQPD